MQRTREYHLVWAEVPDDSLVSESWFAANYPQGALERKWEALQHLGIKRDDSLSPFDAYLNHLCALNGLERTTPLEWGLAKNIEATPGAITFMWWLG